MNSQGIRLDAEGESASLTVTVPKEGFEWLQEQGRMAGISAEAVLTLVCDIGRNLIDVDPFHIVVRETLLAAGFNGLRVNGRDGEEWVVFLDLPF